MTTFSVRISDTSAARFDAVAAAAGGRSAMLRQLIESAAASALAAPVGEPGPRSARLMVRLSVEDRAAAVAHAEAMSLRLSGWVAALVRRHVRGRPTFSRPDEVALLAILGEVRRIGVNVNQIARALNTAVMAGEVLELEIAYLEALRTELRAHMSALRDAFEGNLAYWQVRP